MSLINPDNEYDEIIPKKKSSGKIKRLFSKTKFVIIILIIGIIIGILFGHYYIEPFLNESGDNQLKLCIASKEILTIENDCLYKLIENPQELIKQCKNS